MKKILANDGIDAAGKAILERAGFKVLTEKVAQENLAGYIAKEDISAVLVRSATQVRKELIDACPGLEVIGRAGVGMDNIDVVYAREQGLDVLNTPGASSQSVAELVFAHIFSLARNLHFSNREMPSRGTTEFAGLKKAASAGFELRGKTLGIIGFGRIGQATAKIALGLGMKVLATDRSCEKVSLDIDLFHTDDTFSIEFPMIPLDELLENSDFITLHVPASKDGRPVIGHEELSKMKDSAVVINTARGGSVDENALLEALRIGKLGGAGLDVFVGEPTPDQRLLHHPRISVSPHIGGSTDEAQERIGIELAEAVVASLS